MSDEARDIDPLIEPDVDELDDPGPRVLQFKVARDSEQRLDKYLQQRIKGASRNQVQKLIESGAVLINGKAVKASTGLRAGDKIDAVLPPPPPRYLRPEPIPLNILYEDDDLIVVNKQAGLIVHPARSNLSGTLLNALAYHFERSRSGGAGTGQRRAVEEASDSSPSAAVPPVPGLSRVGLEDARPGVVHRLDKNTTGVIVVAKRDATHWMIARQFEDRSTLKAYLALVHGTPDPPDAVGGVIDEPIGKHPTIREAMAVRHDSSARPSITLWRVRRRYRGYTLLEMELKTGRTHQIRVHLSYIGCPIVGDLLYGGEAVGLAELATPPRPAQSRRFLTFARTRDEGVAAEQAAAARPDVLLATPALHAALLEFTHPTTGKRMRFTAPVPPPLSTVLAALEPHRIDGPIAEAGYNVSIDRAFDLF